ncbi:MAG: hypothetical protein KGL35_13770 [Bradyrhizobium sp.]|nr:hypothetical protein [Bradyrhizobium sp.]
MTRTCYPAQSACPFEPACPRWDCRFAFWLGVFIAIFLALTDIAGLIGQAGHG